MDSNPDLDVELLYFNLDWIFYKLVLLYPKFWDFYSVPTFKLNSYI